MVGPASLATGGSGGRRLSSKKKHLAQVEPARPAQAERAPRVVTGGASSDTLQQIKGTDGSVEAGLAPKAKEKNNPAARRRSLGVSMRRSSTSWEELGPDLNTGKLPCPPKAYQKARRRARAMTTPSAHRLAPARSPYAASTALRARPEHTRCQPAPCREDAAASTEAAPPATCAAMGISGALRRALRRAGRWAGARDQL